MATEDFKRVREIRAEAEKRGIYSVFTPRHPVDRAEYFRGREAQVASCYASMLEVGSHILIYGDRGVGKTSLATVACERATDDANPKPQVCQVNCDAKSTFHSIWASVLTRLGVEGNVVAKTKEKTEGGGFELNAAVAKGGADTHTTSREDVETFHQSELTPSSVAQLIDDFDENRHGLIVIDEIDRLPDEVDRQLMADLMKQLSDRRTPTTLVLVGIAQTAGDLLAGHPSSQRSLTQVRLDRMDSNEIREILEKGSSACDIGFADDVVDRIVDFSAGYPHFAHLLGQKCAYHAIRLRDYHVHSHELSYALQDAVKEAEESLRIAYSDATSSAQAAGYTEILHALAYIPSTVFSKDDCRRYIQSYTKQDVNETLLDNAVRRFVAEDDSAVLKRVGSGLYCFTDPRMPSFLKMMDQSQPKKAV
ncbi:MAG: ATP-binding protein [candidate division WS1 bacterium]|jgi:GTPase SAR1 family protein|nr:ATP-binding protein [candidate division WS1 bacterium]